MEHNTLGESMSISVSNTLYDLTLSANVENERTVSATIDDWPLLLKEYPFIRKGMTPNEYDMERDYYYSKRHK